MFQLQWCWKWRYDRNARYGSYGHTFNITVTQRAIILKALHHWQIKPTVSCFGQQQIFLFWFTGYESAANSKSPTFTDGLPCTRRKI
jgi:hypothetical protein